MFHKIKHFLFFVSVFLFFSSSTNVQGQSFKTTLDSEGVSPSIATNGNSISVAVWVSENNAILFGISIDGGAWTTHNLNIQGSSTVVPQVALDKKSATFIWSTPDNATAQTVTIPDILDPSIREPILDVLTTTNIQQLGICGKNGQIISIVYSLPSNGFFSLGWLQNNVWSVKNNVFPEPIGIGGIAINENGQGLASWTSTINSFNGSVYFALFDAATGGWGDHELIFSSSIASDVGIDKYGDYIVSYVAPSDSILTKALYSALIFNAQKVERLVTTISTSHEEPGSPSLRISTNQNGYTIAASVNSTSTNEIELSHIDISSSFQWSLFNNTTQMNLSTPYSVFVNKRKIAALATNLKGNTNGTFFSENNIFAKPIVETLSSSMLQSVVDGKGNVNIIMQDTNGVEVATYPAVPVINSVTPNNGPLAGGTPVIITGVGFKILGSSPEVLFGRNLATNVVVVSDNEIIAVSPAAQQVGSVYVQVRALVDGKIIHSPLNQQSVFNFN